MATEKLVDLEVILSIFFEQEFAILNAIKTTTYFSEKVLLLFLKQIVGFITHNTWKVFSVYIWKNMKYGKSALNKVFFHF